jgi:hypothetical protein
MDFWQVKNLQHEFQKFSTSQHEHNTYNKKENTRTIRGTNLATLVYIESP